MSRVHLAGLAIAGVVSIALIGLVVGIDIDSGDSRPGGGPLSESVAEPDANAPARSHGEPSRSQSACPTPPPSDPDYVAPQPQPTWHPDDVRACFLEAAQRTRTEPPRVINVMGEAFEIPPEMEVFHDSTHEHVDCDFWALRADQSQVAFCSDTGEIFLGELVEPSGHSFDHLMELLGVPVPSTYPRTYVPRTYTEPPRIINIKGVPFEVPSDMQLSGPATDVACDLWGLSTGESQVYFCADTGETTLVQIKEADAHHFERLMEILDEVQEE